ncbi:MAG TPA: protein kinase, partial [Kofleriaceae bacterium]
TEGDRDYIAMELVEGASIDVWLSANPPESEVIEAMLAAGRGLAAAHRAGLVHRDFKPQNVLRSSTGRVMVTDFGLARGLGEEHVTTLDESPRAKATATGSTDSVLDAPLTQTGALLGTPAYMAPEQFEGLTPDPRTDQFAFCITAWQMLTGGRPYAGGSITELQIAASEGAASVKTMLPPLIRLALVRGLEPDPEKRWPDMDSLLDELDRVTRPKRAAWVVPVAIVVLLGLVIGAFAIARRGRIPASAGRPCEPADSVFGDAWSPQLRAQLAKELPLGSDAFGAIADPFDAFRESWMRNYDEACRFPPDKLPRARLSCLLAARDNVAAVSMGLTQAPPEALRHFNPHDVLPVLSICNVDKPVMQPFAPADKRAEVASLLARGFGLRVSHDVEKDLSGLIDKANQIGYQPVIPVLQMMAGNTLLSRHDIVGARRLLNDALVGVRTNNDIRLQGAIRSSLLEASTDELEKPGSTIKPGELPTEIASLLVAARSTAKAASNDAMLDASASLLEAQAWAARAQWTRDKHMYEAATAAAETARQTYIDAGDLTRAAVAAVTEADIALQRADDRALDDAMYAARSASDALEKAKLEGRWDLGEIQAQVAFARGDFAEAAQRYAKLGPRPEPPPGAALEFSGRITNAAGAPASGATVIAWDGELRGDPSNLVTDDRQLVGERVTTNADGTFTINAHATSAIVAQWKNERSAPLPITAFLVEGGKGRGPIALRTAAHPQPVNGSVTGDWHGELDAFARYDIEENHWLVRAPVRRDHAFTLTGLPAGKSAIGLVAMVGDGERTVLASSNAPGNVVEIAWPSGPPIEIVARGPLGAPAYAWIIPLQTELPGSPEMLERAALTASSAAGCALHAIGADATPGGKDIYEVGDRHCVLANNPNAKLTVCITGDGTEGDGRRTVCAPVEVTAPPHDTPTEPAVVLLNTSPANGAPLK